MQFGATRSSQCIQCAPSLGTAKNHCWLRNSSLATSSAFYRRANFDIQFVGNTPTAGAPCMPSAASAAWIARLSRGVATLAKLFQRHRTTPGAVARRARILRIHALLLRVNMLGVWRNVCCTARAGAWHRRGQVAEEAMPTLCVWTDIPALEATGSKSDAIRDNVCLHEKKKKVRGNIHRQSRIFEMSAFLQSYRRVALLPGLYELAHSDQVGLRPGTMYCVRSSVTAFQVPDAPSLFNIRPLQSAVPVMLTARCVVWAEAGQLIDADKCAACGRQAAHAEAFMRCSRCKTKFYCGVACQRHDWVEGHRDACPASPHGADGELVCTNLTSYVATAEQLTALVKEHRRMVCSPLYHSNASQFSWTDAAVALMTEHGEADHRRAFDLDGKPHNETIRARNIDCYGLERGTRDENEWELHVRRQFARWARDLLTASSANA